MSRDDAKRKKERKARNKANREALLKPTGIPGRNRWQGEVSFKFGRHPDANWNVKFSGVKIPIEDPSDIEGAVELTELALKGTQDVN